MSKPVRYRIPYGIADFIKLRQKEHYLVDKTHHLPLLEEAGDFLFLIRPRRFGKSLLQSVMECYYDCARAGQFDQLFAGTWIHDHPTAERHAYLVLRFDFSLVHGRTGAALEASFADHIRIVLQHFFRRYAELLPPSVGATVLAERQPHKQLEQLNLLLNEQGRQWYLFIDEYDNFTNTVLSGEGRDAYRALTHGRGFLRDFFAELKGAVGGTGGALARLFITGVSPVTLDDVTSGFNIAGNISLNPQFNTLLGFTAAELETLFAAFGQDFAAHREVMNEWYDHYRFCDDASESITNPDMALYYLQSIHQIGRPPRELIDSNVRIDYGKLRHLIQLDRKLNGSFGRLNQIITDRGVASRVKTSFPAEQLQESENFISLLYYFGLLTFSNQTRRGEPVLVIPNQTVEQLLFSYIREALGDVGLFCPEVYQVGEYLKDLAWDGDWRPFFDHLSAQIGRFAGMRDYLNGEKVVQGFLIAWLNLSPWFRVFSEREMGGGFVDLYLAPNHPLYPELGHGYLIELKYLSRSSDTPARRAALIEEARQQLARYRNDPRVVAECHGATLHALILLHAGWELVHAEEM